MTSMNANVVADNSTINTTAMQAAIDAVSASGGGDVVLPEGITVTGPLVWKSRVKFKGQSKVTTELKLAGGSNATFLKSENFDALTGQNKWTEADGVIVYPGLENIRINGNAAQQTAGDGMQLYAKGIHVRDAIVDQCFGRGIYSECGTAPGVSSWPTYCEGDIDGLVVGHSGGHGWQIRGPHDLSVRRMVSLINGGDGVRVETASGYMGSVDFGSLHSYANSGAGLRVVGAEVRGAFMRLEDNAAEGLYLDGATNTLIGTLHMFDNCITSGSFQGVIDADSHHTNISNLLARNPGRPEAGGLSIRSHYNRISGEILGFNTSTGVGLDIDASGFNDINVSIFGYAGAGAIGLRTQETTQLFWNQIRATIGNCKTLWKNGVVGANNKFNITGSANAGQTQFTGVGPNTGSLQESFNVDLWKSGSATVSYRT